MADLDSFALDLEATTREVVKTAPKPASKKKAKKPKAKAAAASSNGSGPVASGPARR
jgi:hypothetical protein